MNTRHLPASVAIVCLAANCLTGCISGAIARASGKGRELLAPGTAQSKVTERFGAPLSAPPEWVSEKTMHQASSGDSAVVWKVKGRPAQAEDGSGQATVSAVTLGLGEIFMLPATLIEVSSDAVSIFYLVCYFDAGGLLTHHLALKDRHPK